MLEVSQDKYKNLSLGLKGPIFYNYLQIFWLLQENFASGRMLCTRCLKVANTNAPSAPMLPQLLHLAVIKLESILNWYTINPRKRPALEWDPQVCTSGSTVKVWTSISKYILASEGSKRFYIIKENFLGIKLIIKFHNQRYTIFLD